MKNQFILPNSPVDMNHTKNSSPSPRAPCRSGESVRVRGAAGIREQRAESRRNFPLPIIILLFACAPILTGAQPPGEDSPRPLIRGALVFENPVNGPRLPANYKLLYEQDFETRNPLADFVMTDPQAWRLSKSGKGTALEHFTQSNYQPPFRSPLNIALIATKKFGDFIMDVDLLSTAREYGHRDMCLFFGAQDPAKFYYIHIATKADPNAHNIFLVNDAPRKNIAWKTTGGIDWGDHTWRKIRVERTLEDGQIKVYFNDFSKPIMIAEDKTFGAGYIGFGSFDDTGLIDNIRIWGPDAEEQTIDFYQPSIER
jgi:hypothetical protein